MKCLLCGVPKTKCSIASPIPVIYINGISKCFHWVKCVLYADHINLFVDSDTIIDLYTLENQAVAAYNDWFFANRLTLNKNKTLHVSFHKK